MSRLTQKIIAVIFAVWLPLFSGSALAASVSMQMPAGHCQDESMQMAGMDMDDMDTSAHHASDTGNQHAPACDSCGLCHLACTAAVHSVVVAVQTAARDATPYAVSFRSFISAPLLPPPLALV